MKTIKEQACHLLLLASSLAYFSTLKIEAIFSCETPDSLQTTRPYNPEDRILNIVNQFYVYLTASFCLFKVRTRSYACPCIQLVPLWTPSQHSGGLQTFAQVRPVKYNKVRF
jgi:hypothetical protein